MPPSYGGMKAEKFFFGPSSIPLPDGGLIIGAVSLNERLILTVNVMVPLKSNGYLELIKRINDNAVMVLHQVM